METNHKVLTGAAPEQTDATLGIRVQPLGQAAFSATQWEDALGVPKPALRTAAPSLPRALAPQLFAT